MLCAVINKIHFSVYSLMSLWSHLTPALKVGTCRGGGGGYIGRERGRGVGRERGRFVRRERGRWVGREGGRGGGE